MNSFSYNKTSSLDEKGFVFFGKCDGLPYLCAIREGQPWLFRWNEEGRHWEDYRTVTQSEIWHMHDNLTDSQQQFFRDQHVKWERKTSVFQQLYRELHEKWERKNSDFTTKTCDR